MDIITNADILKNQIDNDNKDLAKDMLEGLYDLPESFPLMEERLDRIVEKQNQWLEMVNAIPSEAVNELTERI